MRAWESVAPAVSRLTSYLRTDLRGDVMGGVVASFLLIPAALSYGALTGLGPTAGLYGTLAVGLFGAIIGGTRGIISGPNANVSIIMAAVVAEYTTSLPGALAAAVLAGIIQIAFGLLRFGRYISYMPSALMDGFFCGVGILIVTIQVLPALGVPFASGRMIDVVRSWPAAVLNIQLEAAAITAICIGAGLAWPRRLARFVPDQFVMLVSGTLVGMLWLRGAPVVGPIDTGLPFPTPPELSTEFVLGIVQPAFMMALLSSIGVLVTGMMVDSQTGRQQKPNQLLVGHGLGNVAAGLVSGLPGSVSNGSTQANVRAGGRTPISNLTVSVMVLLTLASGLEVLIEQIPRAALASILIVTGWSLINWRALLRVHRIPRGFAFVMLLTALLVLLVDLTIGLAIGFIVATFIGYRALENVELRRLVSVPLLDRLILGEGGPEADRFQARSALVQFPAVVSVASARELVRIIGRDIDAHHIVVFDLSRTEYIDDTAALMMGQLINGAVSAGTRDFIVSGLTGEVAEKLKALNVLDRVPPANVAADLDEAMQIIKPMLAAAPESEAAASRPDARRPDTPAQ